MEILITLQWRDSRLSMESLNLNEDMNIVTNWENIWVPSYVMEDESNSEVESELNWQSFVVVRESDSEPDDLTSLTEDDIFLGSKNSLKLVQAFSVKGYCKMYLYAYPLDSQSCELLIRMKDLEKNVVELVDTNESLIFEGPTVLREYKLTNISIERSDLKNLSAYKITFDLVHFSSFFEFNTYIPTFLMVVICYSTFYFNIDDFNDRIMVSLTALLVLAPCYPFHSNYFFFPFISLS
ncbi:UNVERIFIED_CONTAM: hypothetical protein RMT77_015222 [Armadillidium vulgare]